MQARQISCKITQKLWLAPTVVQIRFEPSKRFRYEAGQFLSIFIPHDYTPHLSGPDAVKAARKEPLRRAYSFCSPYLSPFRESAPYELCIKVVDKGPGSQYLASLNVGDIFQATAPYGNFTFEPAPDKSVCFISTGSGIGPFRAIILSERFQEFRPSRAVSIFGARTEKDLIYKGLFDKFGVEEINAISRPSPDSEEFRGRVTDYLKSLPSDWGWQSTRFFICGAGEMIADVVRILIESRGVPRNSIYQESYFASRIKDPAPTPLPLAA